MAQLLSEWFNASGDIEKWTPSQYTVDRFSDLPTEMVQARRWLVWKSIPNIDRGKKPRKLPYYTNGIPRNGDLDSAVDIANLGTFEDAVRALETGRYTGLGFALGPDGSGNCWQGIDLDDLPHRPELQHLADNLPGYTERSPSGTGMHAIGYGLPYDALGANGTGIEAYSSARYFTVTADGAGLHPPCDLTDFVAAQLRSAHGHGKTTQPESVERIETIDPTTVTELRSALLFMLADDRDLWVRMGHALKSLGDVGRGLWLDWSATSEKFDSADAARVWKGLNPTNTDYKAVFAEAQRKGWLNPRSNKATGGPKNQSNPNAIATLVPALYEGPGTGFDPLADISKHLVDLAEQVDPESVHPHVIEKLVPQGEVTLLAGHGGVGKSFITLLLGIHVALGLAIGNVQVLRRRVLFFSAEDGKAELQRRVVRICRTLGIHPTELVGWLFILDLSDVDPTLYSVDEKSGKGGVTQTMNTLAQYVHENEIGLAIIDNASDVFDGNEIVRKQVKAFIRALRTKLARPDRAVILLAHVSKASAHNSRNSALQTEENYSGSTAWHNSVRSRISLDLNKQGAIELTHLKANYGPKALPIHFEWHGAVPMVSGTCEVPGAALAASLIKSAEDKQKESYKTVILSIVKDCELRGQRVPTSVKGAYSTFHTLRIHPDFPETLTSDLLNRLVIELEKEGKLVRVDRRTKDRKTVQCFTTTPDIEPGAPSPRAVGGAGAA